MKLGDKRIFDINTNISNLVLKFLINYLGENYENVL